MKISETLDPFEAWLRNTRDLSPHSIKAYLSDVQTLSRTIGDRPASSLTEHDILAMLDSLRNGGGQPSSIRRRYVGACLYFRWLNEVDVLASDPTSNLKLRFSKPRRLPKALSSPELRQLLAVLEAPAVGGYSAVPITHQTTFFCIAIMIGTGIRVGELVALTPTDLDLPAKLIRIRGKGQRERVVYLSNELLCDALGIYQEATRSPTTLLQNRNGRPLTAEAVRGRLRTAAQAAGISRPITPHMLRHTAATQLIEAGVDIRYIQRLLGHASISTTEIYTHVADQPLREAVVNADVLGNLLAYG